MTDDFIRREREPKMCKHRGRPCEGTGARPSEAKKKRLQEKTNVLIP